MDGFTHKTYAHRRFLEVEILENRLLLAGVSSAPVEGPTHGIRGPW